MEAWELSFTFYPYAGGSKKEEKKKAEARFAGNRHCTDNIYVQTEEADKVE